MQVDMRLSNIDTTNHLVVQFPFGAHVPFHINVSGVVMTLRRCSFKVVSVPVKPTDQVRKSMTKKASLLQEERLRHWTTTDSFNES